MKRSVIPAVCLLFGSCYAGERPRAPSICPPEGYDFEAVTMNAGLAPGVVDLASPRKPVFAREISMFRGADAICLQEIWQQDAVDAVLKNLALPADNVYRIDTRGWNEVPGQNVCSEGQIRGVLQCAQKRCAGVPPERTALCAYQNCTWDLIKLYLRSRTCIGCLTSSVGKSIDGIHDACVRDGGASRAYGGQNGTILASRWPLKDKEYVQLPSSGVNRVALFARIQPPGSREPIEVACMHVSMLAEVPPLSGQFDTWEEEQQAQIAIVSARLQARAGRRPQILLGDMNAGPGIRPNIEEASAQTWEDIISLGFTAAEAQVNSFCSECVGNNLRDAKKSYLIDHVLVRDPPGGTTLTPVCSFPILTAKHEIVGYDGKPVMTNLSDHYGVLVRFKSR